MALYRIHLKTKGGLTVFAKRPERKDHPVAWVRERRLGEMWPETEVLDVLTDLRRKHAAAKLEAVT